MTDQTQQTDDAASTPVAADDLRERLARTIGPAVERPAMPSVWFMSTGPAVAEAQALLAGHGLYDEERGDDAGLFGIATEAAVRAFQTARGLRPTGVVDTETWNALRRTT